MASAYRSRPLVSVSTVLFSKDYLVRKAGSSLSSKYARPSCHRTNLREIGFLSRDLNDDGSDETTHCRSFKHHLETMGKIAIIIVNWERGGNLRHLDYKLYLTQLGRWSLIVQLLCRYTFNAVRREASRSAID